VISRVACRTAARNLLCQAGYDTIAAAPQRRTAGRHAMYPRQAFAPLSFQLQTV
jgi:hypothetical protein